MKFNIPVDICEFSFNISPDRAGLVMGSCFAEHIGGWLRQGKMPVGVNPFGVLYNPASLAAALERLDSARPFTFDDLFEHNGLWHSSMHHGSFSGAERSHVLSAINEALEAGVRQWRQSEYLLLTLGTAWVYDRDGQVVANCHKLPAREFRRRRMSVAEVVEALSACFEKHPRKQVGLTVSPVIHRGDGLVENQLSKSTLVVAAHELAARFPGRVHYFPAYEIVTAELRDYRFYADDMCHPSELAIRYVQERFAETVLTPESRELVATAEALRQAMKHRPLHPDSPEYERFRQKMLQKAQAVQQKYKNADFGPEISFFG